MMPGPGDIQGSYDRVADEYARRIFHELEDKPFDREILDRFAGRVGARAPVYDLGCGPGHVARYLHQRGIHMTGMDLSPGMVRRASAQPRDLEEVGFRIAEVVERAPYPGVEHQSRRAYILAVAPAAPRAPA
jgi:trans-aconitate methyltransferase